MTIASIVPRILIVDDDAADRMAVVRALGRARMPLELTECSDAGSAMSAVVDGHYDCVLLDYLLPGATALELLPVLKPHLNGTPIIVLTAHGDEQIAVNLMKSGVSDYVRKDGLDPRELARVVVAAVELNAVRAQLERADRARKRQSAALRDLLAATPVIYGGLTYEERWRNAAQVALRICGAESVLVGMRLPERAFAYVARGELVEPLIAPKSASPPDKQNDEWVHEWNHSPVEPGPGIVRRTLYDRSGHLVGVMAVRLVSTEDSELQSADEILAQVVSMTTAAVDHLRLSQSAELAAEGRDAIMGVVTHNLRSPLSAIGLGISLLRDEKSVSEVETATVLDRMERSTRQMKRLIDDLQDIARIENREFTVDKAAVPLGTLFADVAQQAATIRHSAQVTLHTELATELAEVPVLGDRRRLQQLLMSLVENALKFTRHGTVELRVQAAADILLSVSDTGPGIPAEDLPHVFERFWRHDRRGLGLGLYVARAICEAHGGRVWVESTVGEGATFYIALPRA